jgi:adenylate cyclase
MVHERSVRVERRLSAILAADVAGYSRLMHNDEEATHAKLTALLTDAVAPAIAEHRGRIVKNTGDGFLAEFPSAVEAVRAALQFQTRINDPTIGDVEDRRIAFRVGINIGDVIVEPHDIFGDGVNIAARLESIAEPGGICISSFAYDQVRGKVGVEFTDLGEQNLKNINRPVRAYRVKTNGGTLKAALALPDKPSIAVLPFENMSDAAENTYFSDGIAEDIITELSRYPDLFVIARNSSFTYRGKSVRATNAARKLGVQYILEGSVRRSGNSVRITAQLIDAVSDKHLWAQRYDRDLKDIFAIQDEVTKSIVAVLPARIEAAAVEEASRKTSNSLEAYDYLLRGKYYHHLITPEANQEAEANFDHALELDPRFAAAYAWKACTLGQARIQGFRPATPELMQEISLFVGIATRLDENDTECHRIMCRLALIEGQFAKSEHHLDRALAMNPNDPRLVVQRGINLTYLGDPTAAIPWIEQAMRLDPFSADRYYLDLVRALFMAERAVEAIEVLERMQPTNYEHSVWLAACCAATNEDVAAREAGKQAVALRPDLSISTYGVGGFTWKRPEDKARLHNNLLRSGLPE